MFRSAGRVCNDPRAHPEECNGSARRSAHGRGFGREWPQRPDGVDQKGGYSEVYGESPTRELRGNFPQARGAEGDLRQGTFADDGLDATGHCSNGFDQKGGYDEDSGENTGRGADDHLRVAHRACRRLRFCYLDWYMVLARETHYIDMADAEFSVTGYTIYFQYGNAVNSAVRRYVADMEGYISEAYTAESDDNPYLQSPSQRPARRRKMRLFEGLSFDRWENRRLQLVETFLTYFNGRFESST